MNCTHIIEKMDLIWTNRDPRVEGWLLMDSPKPMLMLMVLYLSTVFVGKTIMKNRQPFNVTGLMVAYNFFIVILNIYIVSQFLLGAIRLRYNWLCEPCNRLAVDVETMRIVSTRHLYLLSKPMEWLDTFFFIIRKKNQQLSFLHVYHHCSILAIAWIYNRWAPSGSGFLMASVNALVHVIMYTYYTLAALGPSAQKYLWWKKYLTMLQLLQFALAIFQSIHHIRIGCDHPLFLQVFGAVYVGIFLFLFLLFYNSTYKKDSKLNPQILRKSAPLNEINKDIVASNMAENVQPNLLSKENLRHRTMIAGF